MDSTITQWSGACQGSGSEGPRVQSPRATAAGQWEARLTTPLQNWPVWSWTERHPGQRRGLPFKIRRVTINQTEMWSYWYFTGIWGCPCGQVRQISRGEGSRRNVGARSPFGCLAHVLGLFCVSFGGILRHLVDKIQKRGVTKLKEDGLWGGAVAQSWHIIINSYCASFARVPSGCALGQPGAPRVVYGGGSRRKRGGAGDPQLDGGRWEAEGGSRSHSESEGGDQPSAENSASSGSRSTPVNKPKKRSKKRKSRGGRKTRKKREKPASCSSFLFAAICQVPSSGVHFFFCASSAREKPPKHKVEREKCEATGLCVSTRRQDSLLIHAVQCNGTWTRVIVACKCCDNRVCDHIYLLFFLLRCPVAAIEKRGEAG